MATTHDAPPAAGGLLGAVRSVLADHDLGAVLPRVVAAARELTGARYAALGLIDAERGELERFVTSGLDELSLRRIGAPPAGRGVLSELITNPVPLRLDDVSAHARAAGVPPGHPPVAAFLGVPVLVGGAACGNLYVAHGEPGVTFTDEDEHALVVLAGLAGVAVDRERSVAAADAQRSALTFAVEALDATVRRTRRTQADRLGRHAEATERDRARWARALHEDTVPGLAALRMVFAAHLRTGDPAGMERALREGMDRLAEAIAALGALAGDLRPAALDDLGLTGAIHELAALARADGLAVEVDAELLAPGGGELEIAAYRIVQEAMANARAHGRARTIDVTIRDDGSYVVIAVRDDGGGFDPDAPATGLGLAAMRQHAERLQGTFDVRSAAGEGTVVIVSLRRPSP
jgi:signal transduction histidine kinase